MREVVGTIRYRLLLNWAADPAVVRPLLPAPFRPQLVGGAAVVGICALRLDDLRPRGWPRAAGVCSDNAAHRIAVEWDGPEGVDSGVVVLRRDTAQLLPALAGGRLFPGVHGRASFTVHDEDGRLCFGLETRDGLRVDATATPTSRWSSRLFPSVDAAIDFFGGGDRGFSSSHRGTLEGVGLATPPWRPELVDVEVHASYFDDGCRFPPGSIDFDGGLLLRDLPVVWRRTAVPGGEPQPVVGMGGG